MGVFMSNGNSSEVRDYIRTWKSLWLLQETLLLALWSLLKFQSIIFYFYYIDELRTFKSRMTSVKERPSLGRPNRQERHWETKCHKRTMGKKSLCATLVNCRRGSAHEPILSSRCITWNLYRDLVLKTVDKLVRKGFYYSGRNQITLQGVPKQMTPNFDTA